jgi:hypothetical protein
MYRLKSALRTLLVICTVAFTATAEPTAGATTSTDNIAALGGAAGGFSAATMIIFGLTNGMPLTGF